MKLLFENWRKFLLTEKLMLKPGPDGWDKYRELVAKAYEDADIFDEGAVNSFEAIGPFIDKMFKRISSRVDVQFVDEDPYEGPEEMCDDALNNGVLKIWKGGTEHQIFNPELNLKLRAVHDYMTHCQRSTDFTFEGEIASYNSHMKTVPPSAAGALFTEVVGQAAFFLEKGYFPPQKIAILKGFDFFNVGEVDPEITGYRLDRKKKELIEVKEENEASSVDPEVIELIEDYIRLPIRKMYMRETGTILVQLNEEYESDIIEELQNYWKVSSQFEKLREMGYDVKLASRNEVYDSSNILITKDLL